MNRNRDNSVAARRLARQTRLAEVERIEPESIAGLPPEFRQGTIQPQFQFSEHEPFTQGWLADADPPSLEQDFNTLADAGPPKPDDVPRRPAANRGGQPMKTRRVRRPVEAPTAIDEETQAIHDVLTAVKGLSYDSRRRVLWFVLGRK